MLPPNQVRGLRLERGDLKVLHPFTGQNGQKRRVLVDHLF